MANELELRPEVAAFAQLMEARLREKDEEHKGRSWKKTNAYTLRFYPHQYAARLRTSIENGAEVEHIARLATDVANFAMMIADVMGGLE